jgi:hypothetical protein
MSTSDIEALPEGAALTAGLLLNVLSPVIIGDVPMALDGESVETYLERNREVLARVDPLVLLVMASATIDDVDALAGTIDILINNLKEALERAVLLARYRNAGP